MNNLSLVQHGEVSPLPANVLLLKIWTSVLFPLKFSAYILVISY